LTTLISSIFVSYIIFIVCCGFFILSIAFGSFLFGGSGGDPFDDLKNVFEKGTMIFLILLIIGLIL
jgi:hypothetical protein